MRELEPAGERIEIAESIRRGADHRWRAAWRVRARDALDCALSGPFSVLPKFTQSTDSKGPRVRAGLALARTR